MIACPAGSQPVKVTIAVQPAAFVGTDKKMSNSLFYLGAIPGGVAMSTFKNALDTAIAAAWAAALSVEYLAPTLTIKDMTNYFNAEQEFLPGVNGAYAGTVTGDALPPSQGARIQKKTALGGKTNRGTMCIPMLPKSGTNDDGLTAGEVILMGALATALTTPFTAGGVVFAPQLFSPTLSDVTIGTTGIWMQPWTGYRINEVIRGLKRRVPKSVYA